MDHYFSIAFKVRPEVEEQWGAKFPDFDVLSYKTLDSGDKYFFMKVQKICFIKLFSWHHMFSISTSPSKLSASGSFAHPGPRDRQPSRAEEFSQNYVRSAATSVDKSENSPQFSYINLRWMRWIFVFKFNTFNAKLCKKTAVNFPTCQR